MNITKTIRITASRDLGDLVEKNIMIRLGGGCGGYYELDLEYEIYNDLKGENT